MDALIKGYGSHTKWRCWGLLSTKEALRWRPYSGQGIQSLIPTTSPLAVHLLCGFGQKATRLFSLENGAVHLLGAHGNHGVLLEFFLCLRVH